MTARHHRARVPSHASLTGCCWSWPLRQSGREYKAHIKVPDLPLPPYPVGVTRHRLLPAWDPSDCWNTEGKMKYQVCDHSDQGLFHLSH